MRTDSFDAFMKRQDAQLLEKPDIAMKTVTLETFERDVRQYVELAEQEAIMIKLDDRKDYALVSGIAYFRLVKFYDAYLRQLRVKEGARPLEILDHDAPYEIGEPRPDSGYEPF